jgi:predicted metal-dependent HD superfamily phosphohydrolase
MGKELMSAEAFQVFSALFSTPSSQKYSPEVTEKVDLFTDLLEENYRNASQQLRQLMKKYSKNSKEYHLLQFILTNINPLSKKQTINQSMKTLK